MSQGVDIACFSTQIALILATVIAGGWLQGWALAFVAGAVFLGVSVGYNVSAVPLPSYLFTILSTMAAVSVAEGLGVYRIIGYYSEKPLRKAKWALPFIGGTLAFGMTVLSGTEHLTYALYPWLLETCLLTGLRPSKALSAAAIGGVLGSLCSPFGGAYEVLHSAVAIFKGENELSYLDEGYILISACFVGTLVACACTLIEGKDLGKDEKFRRRLMAGLLRVPRPEAYLAEDQLSDMRRNRIHRMRELTGEDVPGSSSRRSSRLPAIEEDKSLKQTKTSGSKEKSPTSPLREFSNISVLSEGDYIHTIARDFHKEEDTLDINDRVIDDAQRNRSSKKASNVMEPKNTTQIEDLEKEAGAVSQRMPSRKISASNAKVCWAVIAVAFIGFALMSIWNWLRNEHTDVIPGDRQPEREFVIIGINLMIAFMSYLFGRIDSVKLAYQTSTYSGVGTVLIAGAMSLLLRSFYHHWEYDISDRSDAYLDKASWSCPFIIFFVSLFSYDLPKALSTIIPVALKNEVTISSVSAFVPAAASIFILPIHPLAVGAILADTTSTTRWAKYLVDHPFIFPGLVGMAAAIGVAFGIAHLVC